MDNVTEAIAMQEYQRMKESSNSLKGLLFNLFIITCILLLLIVIWKNPVLQLILSTTAFVAVVISIWYLFHHHKTEKAARKAGIEKPAPKPYLRPRMSTQSKIENIIKSLETTGEHHSASDEQELGEGVSNIIRDQFPKYSVNHRIQTSDRQKVVVDNIDFHLKVADKKSKLNETIANYRKSKGKDAFIILDVGKVPDIDKYVENLQQKGAKVIVIKKKD